MADAAPPDSLCFGKRLLYSEQPFNRMMEVTQPNADNAGSTQVCREDNGNGLSPSTQAQPARWQSDRPNGRQACPPKCRTPHLALPG